MTDEPATRRELELLRRELDHLAVRVENMDRDGTRGVIVLQERISELAKDVIRLESALTAHEVSHQNEAAARERGRRWLITTGIALVVMLCAVLALLVQVRADIR